MNGWLIESQMIKILVYRLGSLGDTLLALPALHLVRRHYPDSRVTLLTNRPVHIKAPPMLAILENSGLADDVIDYNIGLRGIRNVAALRRTIMQEGFDLGINLAAPRGLTKSMRDYWFFRSCGIKRVIGTPWRSRDLHCTADWRSGIHEWEAQRLLRRVKALGSSDLTDPALWDLRLTAVEQSEAGDVLAGAGIGAGFLALSVGTKVEVKDWSEPNWLALMLNLRSTYHDLPVVAVGSEEESERTERCLALWPGPKLNLCGRVPVRTVAAVLARARVFVGHDSGPMHLAATMGVPCVAIFAARNLPGQWYPKGHRSVVIYHKTDCYGCDLEVCPVHLKKCILSITVKDVGDAVRQLLPALRMPTPTT